MTAIRRPKRNRRLRKKLFVDEYTVYGFEVFLTLKSDDPIVCEELINELVEFIQARELVILGGGYGDAFEGFVHANERYTSATNEDRQALEAWLAEHKDIGEHTVGSLEDLYYGNALEE